MKKNLAFRAEQDIVDYIEDVKLSKEKEDNSETIRYILQEAKKQKIGLA